jgi:hypothetical protein
MRNEPSETLESTDTHLSHVGRNSDSLGLGGLGIESRWGPDPSGMSMGPTQSPVQRVLRPFPGGKAAGAWRWPPTQSSIEVKESVELYLNSPSWPSWAVPGLTSPSTSIIQVYGKFDWSSNFVIVKRVNLSLSKPCRFVEGVQVYLHSFLTSELDRGELLTSRPSHFTQEENLVTHWIGG